MSATEKLISIVYEHKELLGFLNDKHRSILDEWKNKIAGVDETPAADETTDADIPGVNQNDYRDK
jgi:hypothetical protein